MDGCRRGAGDTIAQRRRMRIRNASCAPPPGHSGRISNDTRQRVF